MMTSQYFMLCRTWLLSSKTAWLSFTRFFRREGGNKIAAVHIALFVRRFRCSRSEFLEARILPERIEHRIEPEQSRSEAAEVVRKVFALFFRREGGDDLLEARIAAKRVPEGRQLKRTVARDCGCTVRRCSGSYLLQG